MSRNLAPFVALAALASIYFAVKTFVPASPDVAQLEASASSFEDEDSGKCKLRLLLHSEDWCGPCKLLKAKTLAHPDVKARLKQLGLTVERLPSGPEARSIPTLRLLRDDVELGRLSGYVGPATFLRWIETHLPRDCR